MPRSSTSSVKNTVSGATLSALERKLQYRFVSKGLLQRALTHRSYSSEHNERLEFLGDSVLGLAVAHLLYQTLGQQTEGDLSRVRANLVKQDALYNLAQDLQIAPFIRLGEGEMRSGGANNKPSIQADCVEAIIGAVYLDGGFDAARTLVQRLLDRVSITPSMAAAVKDAKTELQEVLQGKRWDLPLYSVVGITGAAHQQTFEVECSVSEIQASERGLGNSRRAAEQNAAGKMLHLLRSSQQ